ncbi:uncharacterized protein C11orf52 homolog [Rhincodon typus]|uniref:uncharacterized protein C11orf52 homolog n=1 Tax=Rhincodon typus TaxID=259920 RepID=UPI0009A2641A|nr:uncharacterized protein C11orf52 homolog [Rhincodon typus]XP_048471598.1 uncharacterized protein C11orf52 homolog [Rhincodon typus]
MGNVLRLCATRKSTKKSKSIKNSTVSERRTRDDKYMQSKIHEDSHPYDEVAPDIPLYAQINKKRPEDIHYAEVHVIQQGSQRTLKQVKARQKENATEYATINFTPVVKYDRKNGTLV